MVLLENGLGDGLGRIQTIQNWLLYKALALGWAPRNGLEEARNSPEVVPLAEPEKPEQEIVWVKWFGRGPISQK